jgi:hypothetical protein
MQTVSVRGWVKSRPSETDRADSKIPDCKAACKRTAVGPTAWQLDRLQHAGSRSVQWCALNWNTLTGSQYWGQAGTNYRGQAVLNGGRGRGRLCYTCFCHYVSSEQTTSFTPSPRHSQPFRFCAKIFQPVPLFWWGVGWEELLFFSTGVQIHYRWPRWEWLEKSSADQQDSFCDTEDATVVALLRTMAITWCPRGWSL